LTLAGSGGVDLAGVHAFIRGDDLIKSVIVAGGLIKGLYVSGEFGFLIGDRDVHWTISSLWRPTK